MLMESADAGDPSTFKETEIYRQCVAMGIIPSSAEELSRRKDAPSAGGPPLEQGDAGPETGEADLPPDDPSMLELTLSVEGMWCPACAFVIDRSVERISGIGRIRTNFATDSVRVSYNPVKTAPDRIAAEIEKLGYRTASRDENGAPGKRREFIRFAFALLLTMNVMMLSFALYSGFFSELSPSGIRNLSWPLFIMATLVMGCGAPLFKKALAGLKNGSPGMETLIGIASMAAYVYSTAELLVGSLHLYFDTVAMLITLTLLGKLLEKNARDKVSEDLRNFFSLMPKKVRMISDSWPVGRHVSSESLMPGDLFRVTNDEITAADGRITEGAGSVDESSLTGEARPVPKQAGDKIRSGTRIIRGDFKVRAMETGMDSTLGQMIRIMEKTLTGKSALERKTDRWLRRFVPAVLLLSGLTLAACLYFGQSLEDSVMRAVTVMVISCPCALGIAVPLTRVAGISVAGKRGILVREFSAFEKSEKIDTVVFDKTGTLTRGRFSLLSGTYFPPLSEKDTLLVAAALERESDHHIAVAFREIGDRWAGELPQLEEVEIHENGISGIYRGETVRIGSKAFVSDAPARDTGEPASFSSKTPGHGEATDTPGHGEATDTPGHGEVTDTQGHGETLENCRSNGVTQDYAVGKSVKAPGDNDLSDSVVYMSFGGRLCAVFRFGDTVRKGARETIDILSRRGFGLGIISGDGREATEGLGKRIGIENTLGELLPEGKVSHIRKLQEEGRGVAMVGDGINDAPALVRSDLSIAVHSGSHLGRETADITLMRGRPGQIIDFLAVGKCVNRKIRQNLTATFLYNTLSIPLAMSGLLNPLIAVSAMLLSSLSVILNTLSLTRMPMERRGEEAFDAESMER